MSGSFSRRLALQTFLATGGMLAIVAITVACGILAAYIASLNAQTATAIERTIPLLTRHHIRSGDAHGAMRVLIADPQFTPLHFWTVNDTMRVEVFTSANGRTARDLPRTETEFVPRPFGTRLAVAMGTGFGLQLRRLRAADMYIYVTADENAFQRALLLGGSLLALVLVAIGLYASLTAASLTRQAVRPLDEVARALEAFARGDFRSQPVKLAPDDDELRRLTSAVNGAMAQVTQALAERDRAQAQIRRFIADAAHQLRTPLTVIQGFVGIMGSSETPHDRERIIKSINKQTRVLTDLIAKLTLLDRWDDEPMRMEVVHAGELVRDVALPFIAANPQRSIDFSSTPDGYIECDPREFDEALSNVIDNALKYGSPAPIAIALQATTDQIIVTVRDAGRGMTLSECRHAFDRFYRGDDREIAGSGLGLSIAQRVVDRARGRIALQSELDRGTTVTIVLPRADAPSGGRPAD